MDMSQVNANVMTKAVNPKEQYNEYTKNVKGKEKTEHDQSELYDEKLEGKDEEIYVADKLRDSTYERKKVYLEKELLATDEGSGVDKGQDQEDENVALTLEEGSGVDGEQEHSHQRSLESTKDEEMWSQNDLDYHKRRANSKQETVDAHYHAGERYISENNIKIGDGGEIDISEEEESPNLRGEHLPNTNLEDYGLDFRNLKSTVKENSKKDTYSPSIEIDISKSASTIEIPEDIEVRNDMVKDSDITIENDEESDGYKTKEVDELIITKPEGIENDKAIDLDSEMDDDEESSGLTTEEVKEQNASKIPNTNIDNSMYSKQYENQEKHLYTGEHFDATDENLEESKNRNIPKDRNSLLEALASLYHTNGNDEKEDSRDFERKSNIFSSHKSPYSLRYIKEGEIGNVEDETEAVTKKRMKPVLRGQHLPETTLVEFSFNHISSDDDSLEYKDIEGSSLHNLQEEVKNNAVTGKENMDKILKAETKFEKELAGDDITYSKEVVAEERQYFR